MSIQDRIDDIKKRLSSATEGPWEATVQKGVVTLAEVKSGDSPNVIYPPNPNAKTGRSPRVKTGNLTFIAHSRDDVEWLLALPEQVAGTCLGVLVEAAQRGLIAQDVAEELAARMIAAMKDLYTRHDSRA